MMIENLETRRLYAVTAAVNGGVLTVTGDDGCNLVDVRLSGADTLVVRTATAIETTDESGDTTDDDSAAGCAGHRGGDFGTVTSTNFDISDSSITRIVVNAGGGDDRVSIARTVTLPTTINGGDGNDELSGGGGADTIDGSAGDIAYVDTTGDTADDVANVEAVRAAAARRLRPVFADVPITRAFFGRGGFGGFAGRRGRG